LSGDIVHTFVAICLLAATSNGSSVHPISFAEQPATQPAFVQHPKAPDSLTLYNANGERVAQCDKNDDKFAHCKMEPGMTFDDVMNAWVHAFQDIQGK
jgi:hypothetical protein